MNINKITIAGRLTKDPEIKALPSRINVANFSVAVNRVWKDKDGAKQEAVEFMNVVAFGKTADTIAQYFKKGSPIYLEGRLQTRSWEGDNGKVYRTEIIIESFQFFPRNDSAPKGQNGPKEESGDPKADKGSKPAPAKKPSGKKEVASSMMPSVEYPTEEINPEDIPF